MVKKNPKEFSAQKLFCQFLLVTLGPGWELSLGRLKGWENKNVDRTNVSMEIVSRQILRIVLEVKKEGRVGGAGGQNEKKRLL